MLMYSTAFLGCDGDTKDLEWSRVADSIRVLSVAATSDVTWIGTDGGLIRQDAFRKMLYTPSNSPLTGLAVTALVVDASGIVWIANGADGTWTYDGTQWTRMTTDSGLPGNRIVDFDTGPSGLWMTATNAIACYQAGRFLLRPPPNSGWLTFPFTAVAESLDGTVWIGTRGGGIIRIEDTVWTRFNVQNSPLQSNIIYEVEADPQGGIWIGEGGLTHYTDGRWETFNITNSKLPQNDVVAIAATSNDVWLGTLDDGLVRIASHQWYVYRNGNSILKSNRISSIAAVTTDIFVGTSYGLVKIGR
jgi:ligand-binding sensor domain-containing protein